MDPLSLFRAIYTYFDQQAPNFNAHNIIGISPFINYPKRGVKYALGEMKLALGTIPFTCLIMIYILKQNTLIFLKKSLFSTVIFYWIFILHLTGLIPKIITYSHLNSLNLDEETSSLRRKVIEIFGKRIYNLTTRFSQISIISHVLGLFVSSKVFFTDLRKPDVDVYLFFYCFAFHIRLIYSYFRYKKYFRSFGEGHNPYNLKEISYCEEARREYKSLRQLDKCAICWLEYEEDSRLTIFNCKGDHVFHKECLGNWMKRSLTCPLCRTSLFNHDHEE